MTILWPRKIGGLSRLTGTNIASNYAVSNSTNVMSWRWTCTAYNHTHTPSTPSRRWVRARWERTGKQQSVHTEFDWFVAEMWQSVFMPNRDEPSAVQHQRQHTLTLYFHMANDHHILNNYTDILWFIDRKRFPRSILWRVVMRYKDSFFPTHSLTHTLSRCLCTAFSIYL